MLSEMLSEMYSRMLNEMISEMFDEMHNRMLSRMLDEISCEMSGLQLSAKTSVAAKQIRERCIIHCNKLQREQLGQQGLDQQGLNQLVAQVNIEEASESVVECKEGIPLLIRSSYVGVLGLGTLGSTGTRRSQRGIFA